MRLIKNPNDIIGKKYDRINYHCYHFIQECINVPRLIDVTRDTAIDDVLKYKDLFTKIITPSSYCVVLIGDAHIGIYYDNGVYHNDIGGVVYESLRAIKLKYKGIEFYDISEK